MNATAEATKRKRTPTGTGQDGSPLVSGRDPNYHYFYEENWRGANEDLNTIEEWQDGSKNTLAEVVPGQKENAKRVLMREPMESYLERKKKSQDEAAARTKGRGKRTQPLAAMYMDDKLSMEIADNVTEQGIVADQLLGATG